MILGNLQAQELKKVQLFMMSQKITEAKAEIDKAVKKSHLLNTSNWMQGLNF